MLTLILYSPAISPRLKYIATHLVSGILGIELHLTSNRDEACFATGPVINYSITEMEGAVNIRPAGLLEERGVRDQDINPVSREGIPVFYATERSGDDGFDMFASSFFMISRYEEYLPFREDRHGRFPYNASLACRHSFPQLPLVDIWAGMLKQKLIGRYRNLKFPERVFNYIPTIDIDIPWAFRNKSVLRNSMGFMKALLKADTFNLSNRYRVLFRDGHDHYDTYDKIGSIHSEYDLRPCYFFSSGRYGRYDKGVPLNNRHYRELVRQISRDNLWGIHPSYLSASKPDLLRQEINSLAAITGKMPVRSRQHYLRLRFPDTYRQLIENGIKEDYTLGWAEVSGFRAGTCTPFHFFDLGKEEVTLLRIYPLHIMDGSLKDYMGLGPGEAEGYAGRLVRNVRDVGGTLVTLWHNQSFSGEGLWKDWENVYIEIAKVAKE